MARPHDDDQREDEPLHDMTGVDLKLQAMEYREAAEGRHELMEAMAEDNQAIARATRDAYLSLVETGFNEEQAMRIILARGWHLGQGTG